MRKKVIVDCPDRDRAIWAADLYVSGPAAGKFIKDGIQIWKNSLLALSLRQYKSGMIPACLDLGLNYRFLSPFSINYTMWWVLSLDEYLSYRKKDFKEFELSLTKAIACLEQFINGQGLFRAGLVNYDWNWTTLRPRVSALSNILFLMVIKTAEKWGVPTRTGRYEYEKILNDTFWNDKNGTYTDSSGIINLDANCLAIVSGISGDKQNKKILQNIIGLTTPYGPKASDINGTSLGNWHKDIICPFTSYLFVKALIKMGKEHEAHEIYRLTMLSGIKNSKSYGLKTIPEFWKTDGKCSTAPARREFEHKVSYCHAWSTFGGFY